MSEDARHMGVARHLELAHRLAANAEGLTVAEMAAEMGVVVRTVQRMRAALETVFPMEALSDGPRRRYRIVGGLSPNMVAPRSEEAVFFHAAVQSPEQQLLGARPAYFPRSPALSAGGRLSRTE